jgi:hypothetical protein
MTLSFTFGRSIPIFVPALFIIAKLFNHPRSPTTDEWIEKYFMCVYTYIYICVYIYTHIYIHTYHVCIYGIYMEYYVAVKKNEIMSFAGK